MEHYSNATQRLRYTEGIAVGYRSYDQLQHTPQFSFGHGLTYGRFDYRALTITRSRVSVGEDLDVGLTLTNDGPHAAQEVVQLYISALDSKYTRVPQELKAFTKVALAAGESKHVRLRVRAADLAIYDADKSAWINEPGRFRLSIGASSRDERLSAVIEISGRQP